jgi:hypothetical protein
MALGPEPPSCVFGLQKGGIEGLWAGDGFSARGWCLSGHGLGLGVETQRDKELEVVIKRDRWKPGACHQSPSLCGRPLGPCVCITRPLSLRTEAAGHRLTFAMIWLCDVGRAMGAYGPSSLGG